MSGVYADPRVDVVRMGLAIQFHPNTTAPVDRRRLCLEAQPRAHQVPMVLLPYLMSALGRCWYG